MGRSDERFGSTPFGPSEWGFEGSGFWFRGPNNYVRDNVEADSDSYGFNYWQMSTQNARVPKSPGGHDGQRPVHHRQHASRAAARVRPQRDLRIRGGPATLGRRQQLLSRGLRGWREC